MKCPCSAFTVLLECVWDRIWNSTTIMLTILIIPISCRHGSQDTVAPPDQYLLPPSSSSTPSSHSQSTCSSAFGSSILTPEMQSVSHEIKAMMEGAWKFFFTRSLLVLVLCWNCGHDSSSFFLSLLACELWCRSKEKFAYLP